MAGSYALYVASVLGGIALLMMMPRAGVNPGARRLGALLGAATLGGLWLYLSRNTAITLDAPMAYYYIFSALAIAAAVRVITHTKPVYAALWFVMVVLASAGLFLTLTAEFMAFAMVLIYGGAIVVTYVFVIMLAAQAGGGKAGQQDSRKAGNRSSADDPGAGESPVYDRVAREPLAAVTAGFLLLAVLLTVAFDAHQPNPRAFDRGDAQVLAGTPPAARRPPGGPRREAAPPRAPAPGTATQPALTNVQRIGVDLFNSHPLGLELAGVILLVSLVGSVVITRQKVGEETRDEQSP
jgi:NADH-quinone oxidoreductase subunit J